MAAEMDRHRDTQLSARLGKLIGCKRIRRLRFREDHPAPLVIDATELREALSSGGAVDKLHAKSVL